MPLDITFLGTGGAFTDFRVNYQNNALVHTSAGPVLIDCGGTACQAMMELGIDTGSLAGVIVTHVHGDHVGGLEQLIWHRYYLGPGGPHFRTTPIAAAPDVMEDVQQLLEPQIRWFTQSSGEVGDRGWLHLVDAWAWRGGARGDGAGSDAQIVEIGDVLFSLHATPHVSSGHDGKPCYGVRARRGDAELYFTSDTEFRPEIGELFPDAQAIFHDCAFYPEFKGSVHTHYSQLVTLPQATRARVVLMHHSRVPANKDPVADGFIGAASRYDTWSVGPEGVSVSQRQPEGVTTA